MKIHSLYIHQMRNIKQAEFSPDPDLTVIAGQNGQGKTNLLECVWLLTGAKSFRGSKDYDLVNSSYEFGRLEGKIETENVAKNIELFIGGKQNDKKGRFAKVNGVDYGRASSIAGIFTAVVFDPSHLKLVKGGPEERRKFLDAALCQLYPGYLTTLRRYNRALSQKNAQLKRYNGQDQNTVLDAYDAELAVQGEEIMRKRAAYLQETAPKAEILYDEISKGTEVLKIKYRPCCLQGELAQLLSQKRNTDVQAGFCTAGPHREDFDCIINNTSARAFGSQGQQRSAVLSIKLAEAYTAKQITGQYPVLLLDDVLSELDESRQSFLLSKMGEIQSIVTTCDASSFGRTAGKIVKMENGMLTD